MSTSSEKARAQRLERLRANVDGTLDHPEAALETLVSELQLGEPHPETWEGLHAAAARDTKQAELTRAYETVTVDRRLKQLTPAMRASLMVHAADFFQGIVGDAATAERLLWRLLETVPEHGEAFARLERRFNAATDGVRLGELYALVAARPPKPARELAKAAQYVISLLPAHTPLPDDACRKLLVLLPANHALLGVLESHGRATGRVGLVCELLEESIASNPVSETEVLERRRRLIEGYLGEAKAPEKAMGHVEALLEQDPTDAQARAAAERLLRIPQVASRTAAALQGARRKLRGQA